MKTTTANADTPIRLTVDQAHTLVSKYARHLGNGKKPLVTDKTRPTLLAALSRLSADRGPDAVLSNALGVPHLATRAELCAMITGRLGLREPTTDAFADEGSRG